MKNFHGFADLGALLRIHARQLRSRHERKRRAL